IVAISGCRFGEATLGAPGNLDKTSRRGRPEVRTLRRS
ncbi:hypothetical protein PENNAL_c0572G04459, partial [Penicillium nalgiovense]